MREIYFNDQIDDAEYSGKLYGLGQTFAISNGLTDPTRGGATIAERDDRGSVNRDVHNQTPGLNNSNNGNSNNNNTTVAQQQQQQQQQTQNVTMAGLGPMQAAGIPSAMTPGPYGPMGNGPPGGYMRTMVGGGGSGR
jgi:CCR4-NOT transcription complex subunit 7/8